MNFRPAAILLCLISLDSGSVAIIPTNYLVSKGKEIAINVGNRLVDKTISIKEALPYKLPFSSRDTNKDDAVFEGDDVVFRGDDTDKESLFKPFRLSKMKETPSDFSQIVSFRHPVVCDQISNMRLEQDFSSDLSIGSRTTNHTWIDDYGRKLGVWSAGMVGMQLFGQIVSRDQFVLVDELFDRLLSRESAFAVKTIRKIIENFPTYGIIDVFSLHPTKDVVASIIALSRLQRVALESLQFGEDVANRHRYLFNQDVSSGGAIEGNTSKNFAENQHELLSDLAHYATLAHCAYGWKFGLLSGRLHFGDKAMLQRKTGVQKSHILYAQWKSKTHLPAHFLVRDLQRKTIVLCIRGTLSPKDILTDLCCTADEFLTHGEDIIDGSESTSRDVIRSMMRPKHKAKAHHGMLQAARNIAKMTRTIISTELASNPEFNLVIVGHSLGGGVAAVLGSLWRETFPGVKVYAFGCPCVGPADFHPFQSDAITCVVGEGDPFSCLSLGHLADASLALSKLCRDSELRNAILKKTKKGAGKLDEPEIRWCMETMKTLEAEMQSEKFYPPGRVLFIRGNFFGSVNEILLREVDQESVFRHLRFHPRMFDLSLHVPHRYEILLARIWNFVNEGR